MGVPEVSVDVVKSTSASMTHAGKKFWKEALHTMALDNPLLYQILTVNEASSREATFKEGYKRGAALMYILISRQIEANEMNEVWGLDSIEVEGKEVVNNKLGVMDLTAITLCEENELPIRVFDGTKEDNIYKVLTGDKLGTVIK